MADNLCSTLIPKITDFINFWVLTDYWLLINNNWPDIRTPRDQLPLFKFDSENHEFY